MVIAQEQAIEHKEPERRDCNQESSESSWNNALSVGEREIATHQEQDADHRHVEQFARRMEDATSGQSAPAKHHHACDCEASGAHQCGRDVFDGNADAKVGRTPENVDQREGNHDHPPAWTRNALHEKGTIRIAE